VGSRAEGVVLGNTAVVLAPGGQHRDAWRATETTDWTSGVGGSPTRRALATSWRSVIESGNGKRLGARSLQKLAPSAPLAGALSLKEGAGWVTVSGVPMQRCPEGLAVPVATEMSVVVLTNHRRAVAGIDWHKRAKLSHEEKTADLDERKNKDKKTIRSRFCSMAGNKKKD